MRTTVPQKYVVKYLQEIYPNKATFEEIAEGIDLLIFDYLDLQDAISRLCIKGRVVKVVAANRYRYGLSSLRT